MGNPDSNKTEKGSDGIVITLALNEESPSEAFNSIKNRVSQNSENRKFSSHHKTNLFNSQINEMINSQNPNFINKKLDAVINSSSNNNIKETLNNNLIRIKNPNLIGTSNPQAINVPNNSSNPNFGRMIHPKVNGKPNNTIAQDNHYQNNNNNIINQKINLNKYNGEQMNSSNQTSNFNNNNNINNPNMNMNKLINQGINKNTNNNFLNQNSNNLNNNNFLAQQQMQILNQFNNLGNSSNPMQMMNKIALNMQNQSLQMNNNPQQQSFFNNNNNPNSNVNKIVFPNPNAGINQPVVNSQNKNLSFSSNFLHLLNKNYIESKLSSLAHVKILNPVYRNSIIPVVPELFSKSFK